MKQLIVVPYLCHKIHNSFKNAVIADADLSNIIDILHKISHYCNSNKEKIGYICPSHISTRWIYDYEIVEFIIKHEDIISLNCEIPQNIHQLKNCLKILKQLILIFEDPFTSIVASYIILEHAIIVLEELYNNGNIFAFNIRNHLEKYTINSIDLRGILIASYIMTPSGHADFYNRLVCNNSRNLYSNSSFLDEFGINNTEPLQPKIFDPPDEIMECIEKEAIDMIIEKDNIDEMI